MARRFSRLSLSDIGNASRHKYQLDKMMTDLESAFGGVDTAIAALAAAVAAQADATSALTNAATAQSTANTVKRDDSISSSWTSPGTILSASDAGTDATISISAHTRKYSDVSSVSVNSGSVNGLAYSTSYDVYYDQTSRAGGAVTYHATTNPNTGMPGAAAGRHYCGTITTPAAAAPPTSGGVNPPSTGGRYSDNQIP